MIRLAARGGNIYKGIIMNNYEIENYCNICGYRIFYRLIGVDKNEEAILFIHGKGSHSGYLENIIDEALLRRVNFYALDLPGFGNSSGRRGHINSFTDYFEVIDQFIKDKIGRAGVKSLYLVCESMGSLLGFYYAQKMAPSYLKGIIFLPGIFQVREFRNPFLRALLAVLNIINPELNIRGKRSISSYTNNRMFWELLENDPLWVRDKSIRLISEINRYLKYLHKEISRSRLPLLIFHGKDDLYNGVKDCIKVFAEVSFSEENRIVILENSNHWLIIDNDLREIRTTLLDWLNKEGRPLRTIK